MWLLIRAGLLGVIGYMTPRVLIHAGVPLDAWAGALGTAFSQSWTQEDIVAWLCILGAVTGLAIGSQWEKITEAFGYTITATQTPAQSPPLPPTPPPSLVDTKGVAAVPHDTNLRAALFHAANGEWTARQPNDPIDSDTARELQRVYDALERFYESASHDGGIRVWGRERASRPLKIIERTHWQDWHIRPADVFGTEPLRTVPRNRLPDNSGPYFDLHVNKEEAQQVWRHELVPIEDAALSCFEETNMFADVTLSAELRLFQFIVLMVHEARENPGLLSVWGRQIPSKKMKRVPQARLAREYLRGNGTTLGGELYYDATADLVDLAIPSRELPDFIERLKKGETAGQKPASDSTADQE